MTQGIGNEVQEPGVGFVLVEFSQSGLVETDFVELSLINRLSQCPVTKQSNALVIGTSIASEVEVIIRLKAVTFGFASPVVAVFVVGTSVIVDCTRSTGITTKLIHTDAQDFIAILVTRTSWVAVFDTHQVFRARVPHFASSQSSGVVVDVSRRTFVGFRLKNLLILGLARLTLSFLDSILHVLVVVEAVGNLVRGQNGSRQLAMSLQPIEVSLNEASIRISVHLHPGLPNPSNQFIPRIALVAA